MLVIGIGTTGVGGPKRIVEMVEGTFGGRDASRVNVSKEETKDTEENEEMLCYQKIKDELGFDPVRINITHKSMAYEYCEIDKDMQMAQLIYKYGEGNISYSINAAYSEKVVGTDLEDGITDSYIFQEDKLKAEVTEHELEGSNMKEYSAKFEYKGIHYQIIGTMGKEDFEKVLKNLHFPS